jgi:DNA-binding NarL/FixJ family response regulator
VLRILIADRHEIVRRAVAEIVRSRADWEVCSEAADGDTALEQALEEQPDIAVIDVSLPLLDGVTLTRRLAVEASRIRVLLFTAHDDHETIRNGLAAGARGYLLKSDSVAGVEAAISALAANRTYFSPAVSEALLEAAMDKGKRTTMLERFTPRELAIIQLIADGDGNKAIAGKLDISIKTVESHRGSAMRKAGCRTVAEFVRFAMKHNLVPI